MTKKELFIGRINAAVTNEQLDHYFNSFGRVNSFKRPVDRRTGRNRDFAFVSFVENNVFERVRNFQKHSINGFPIDVRVSIPKEDFRAKRKEESLGVVELDQSEIGKKFYKNSMLEDPWRNCNPQQSDPSRARLDQKVKHRNRLFHRVGQQEHQQQLQQQHQPNHHHQQHPHHQQHHFPPNQRPPHPKTLSNQIHHQNSPKQSKTQSPQKVPPSPSSSFSSNSQLPVQSPKDSPTSRPPVIPATQPQKAVPTSHASEAARSQSAPQEVSSPPQLQRSAISASSSQNISPAPVSAPPQEEPKIEKAEEESVPKSMPNIQSQKQASPATGPKSPLSHAKSGTRQQSVSPFRPQNPNFHSSTPPSLRPPILRAPPGQQAQASPLSKQNPPPPPPLKRAPQLAPNRSEPPAQMPKITSFTSTTGNPLQQQQQQTNTQQKQPQTIPASNSENHQSPRIPKNGEQFNLYLNNKLPTSKDDFTVDKHQGINLASNVDKRLLEYFIRIFLNNTNRDVIKFSKLTPQQQDILEAIADKHDLENSQEKTGFVIRKNS